MDMIDRAPQLANGTQWIAAHPEGMAGVKINSYYFADGIAQFQRSLGVIHQLMGMLLNADFFDAVRTGFFRQDAPVGQRHLLPLIA
jgi:hypothetical protein